MNEKKNRVNQDELREKPEENNFYFIQDVWNTEVCVYIHDSKRQSS